MKKKILSLALVVAMIAIIAAGSLAYFTDKDSETNTFTVGNVKIDLIESQLHRVNAGVANGQTSPSELWSNVDMEGTDADFSYTDSDGEEVSYWDGACYTDEQIQADAEDYQDVYLANADIAPGTSYHKMPYVINTGANDAYIRIRVIIPAELDALLDSSMYTQSAIDSGEFTYKMHDSNNIHIYEFTRVNPLAAGEMTFWNVWGSIHMDKDVTNAHITAAKEAGYIAANGTFNIRVEADAIQADGFADAAAAWAAFDT